MGATREQAAHPVACDQVTLFPMTAGQTGQEPNFHGAAHFDLELIESRTLDGSILEHIYRPTLHV